MELVISVLEGIFLALFIAKRKRLSPDATIPVISVGAMVGRIGGLIGVHLGGESFGLQLFNVPSMIGALLAAGLGIWVYFAIVRWVVRLDEASLARAKEKSAQSE